MMAGDEVLGLGQGDVTLLELVVQQEAAAPVVGQAAKAPADERLDSCASEEFARPSRILVHLEDDGLMQMFYLDKCGAPLLQCAAMVEGSR